MAHDLQSVEKALLEHIEKEILLRETPLLPSEDLFHAGFDSMSLTRVLVFVEDRFGVIIPDQEVVLAEVSTVHKLASFVFDRVARSGKP
jgi:acyl carrier protein